MCYSFDVKRLAAHILGVISLVSCQKTLEEQVTEQIRTAANARLDETAVEVSRVRQSGEQAIAEIAIKTAVRMRREGNRWIMEEIRLGDRRWESVDRILRSIDRDRRLQTRAQMDQITEGIRNYRQRHGRIPQLESFEELVDTLCPDYLPEVIRIDAWWTPFRYRITNESRFELRSAGPDEKFGTNDDLVSNG